jgi:hypothetical protein
MEWLGWLAVLDFLSAGLAGYCFPLIRPKRAVFHEYGKVAVAFITGFLLSKVDRVFELWIERSRGHDLFCDQLVARWAIAIASFLLAMTVTYVVRKYVRFGPNAEPSG